MTITPASGTYLVWFASSTCNTNNGKYVYMSIWSGGGQVIASQLQMQTITGNDEYPFCCVALVTVNGSQTIEGRWRVNANSASMYQRTLAILKIG